MPEITDIHSGSKSSSLKETPQLTIFKPASEDSKAGFKFLLDNQTHEYKIILKVKLLSYTYCVYWSKAPFSALISLEEFSSKNLKSKQASSGSSSAY